ncbi:hypothetical protein ACFL5O_05980 [Myxococcota bacterium]
MGSLARLRSLGPRRWQRLSQPWKRLFPALPQGRDWIQALVFWGLGLLAVWPLWTVQRPPLQDLPQHLAAIRVLHDYTDPFYGFQRYFELSFSHTQYLTVYLAGDWLAHVFDVELATRVLISAAVMALPLAVRWLLRVLERDEWLALLVFPLSYNAHLMLGFLNFTAALPWVFWGLGLAIRQRVSPRPRRAWLLGAVVLITFFTHVVPCAFLAAGVFLVGLRKGLRTSLRDWSVLVPTALASIWWVLRTPAGHALAAAAGGQVVSRDTRPQFQPWSTTLRELPGWLTDVLRGPVDEQLLILWGLLMLGTVCLGETTRGSPQASANRPFLLTSLRQRLGLLPVLAGLAGFVTPVSYDWIWPINARFPLLTALLVVPVLPVSVHWLRYAVRGCAVVISVLSFALVAAAFQRFERDEVGALDQALLAIPPGQRVAGLIFQRSSREVKFSPFLHSAAWAQVRRGGGRDVHVRRFSPLALPIPRRQSSTAGPSSLGMDA